MDKEAIARQIVQKLRSQNHQAYFAGGCVRDKLLGILPKDYDIATSASPVAITQLFKKTIPVGIQFGVILVVEDGIAFEVATFRSEGAYSDGRRPDSILFTSVEQDAKRRDFTVNGLYFDPEKNQILDFVGGERDIGARIIQTIGNPEDRFLEDHLRMLRAVRFSVQLGFALEQRTLEAVKKHAKLIERVSAERIRDEFCKILTSANPAQGVRLLDSTGLLTHFLPEMETLKGVEQPPEFHPEGDVFVHTLLLLEALKSPPMELAMGALLHDIAKPATFVRAPDRIRFHGHERLGAEMAKKICKRLAFPNSQTDLISTLVAEHLRFKDASQMKKSTLRRFFALDRFDLHLELHRLDCLASHKNLDAHEYCRKKLAEFSAEPAPLKKLITGADLLELGFRPGKEMGRILRGVEDAVLEGTIHTKEEAIDYVQKNYVKG